MRNLLETPCVLVVAHFKHEIGWTRRIDFPVIVYEWGWPDYEYNVPVNRGGEAAAYLKFIIDHYTSLPEKAIFVHDHETSWHHEGSIVERIVEAAESKDDYHSLNSYKLGSIVGRSDFPKIRRFYAEYLEAELGPIEPYGDWTDGHFGCAQFAVSRTLLRSRTQEFYRRLYECATASDYGYLLEWCWHLIWGQVRPNER